MIASNQRMASSRTVSRMMATIMLVFVTLGAFGCGGGVEGTYSHEESTPGGTMAMSIELKDGGVAVFTMSGGIGQSLSQQGTYTVDGDKVVITIDGDTETFTLKDGALTGDFFGDTIVLTKGGSKGSSGGSAGTSGNSGASSESPSPAATASMSADDRAASDFVQSKLDEYWVKDANGWTNQLQLMNMLGEVMEGEPDTLYRQYREFSFTVQPETLSESQKLNGADYRAGIEFKRTPHRVYRTRQTFEGPPGWSLWEEDTPSWGIAVERRNGKWLITDDDLFTGVKPNAAEIPSGN